MRRAIAALGLALVLAGCADDGPTKPAPRDQYREECERRGGILSQQPRTWWVDYTCPDANPPLAGISG